MDVLTLGETMVLLEPDRDGLMQYSENFSKSIGGAESNVAIGLSRLGHNASWISRLGQDPFGRYIYSYLKGEGVNVDNVIFDSTKRTGIFFKETGGFSRTNIYYYRNKSAASYLQPEDLSEDIISKAEYLHITGITSALSESCHNTVMKAIEIAQRFNVKIIFDPNIRQSLWSSDQYIPILKQIIKHADYFLPGADELELLYSEKNKVQAIEEILNGGTKVVVVKNGKHGASYFTKMEERNVTGYLNENVKDPVGAGDGFAAGFISGLIDGLSLEKSVNRANLVGSMVTMVHGDCEGLPYRSDIKSFLNQKNDVQR